MDRFLSSWKEIASFFGKGVRTVQRWEHKLGLPVYRPSKADQHIVFAKQSELEAWIRREQISSDAMKVVLLLTADRDLGSFVRESLEGVGYLVFGCTSVERALRTLHHGPACHLLIADSALADASGALVQDFLRSRRGIGAVLLRDLVADGDLETAECLDCVVLSKSASVEQLVACVDTLLARDIEMPQRSAVATRRKKDDEKAKAFEPEAAVYADGPSSRNPSRGTVSL